MGRTFGWSLPPGVTTGMIDPGDSPYEVCGVMPDDCICPECPTCGAQGDLKCYEEHGLTRNEDQLRGRRKLDEVLKRDAAATRTTIDIRKRVTT